MFTSGTEHGYFFIFFGVHIFFNEFGEFSESVSFRIDGVFEGSDLVFVVVSGINCNDIRVGNNFIPVLRFYISTYKIG